MRLALCWVAYAGAQPVYKSIDADGNVVYSDNPPPASVRTEAVPIDAGPTPEQVEQAQERTRQLKASADAMESKRRKREQELAEQRRQEAQRRHQQETDARLARLEEQQRSQDYREWGAYYSYPYPRHPIWREPPDGPDYPVVTPLPGIPRASSGGGSGHATRGASHAH